MLSISEALENPKARFFYEDALLLFNEAKDLIKERKMPTNKIFISFMGWVVLSDRQELGYFGLRDAESEWRLLQGKIPKFSIFFDSKEIANQYGESPNSCLTFESKRFTTEGYERLTFFKKILDLEEQERKELASTWMDQARFQTYSEPALEAMTKPSNKDLKKKYLKETKNQKYEEPYKLPLP